MNSKICVWHLFCLHVATSLDFIDVKNRNKISPGVAERLPNQTATQSALAVSRNSPRPLFYTLGG